MAKLNKEQLKKLYDYGGTLTPRDWADLIDSVIPDKTSDNPPVIETTYEEAEALYESGQMIPGILYNFPIRYSKSIHSDTISTTIDHNVYIDNDGRLKNKGSYDLNDNTHREFISDFDWNPGYVSFDIYDTYIEQYIKLSAFYNLNYTTISSSQCNETPDYSSLKQILDKANVPYDLTPGSGEFYLKINTHCAITTLSTGDPDSTSFNYTCIAFPNKTILCIHESSFYDMDLGDYWYNYTFSEITDAEFTPKGVYNLDFGTFKHSVLVEGNSETTPDCIKFEGDFITNISTEIYPIEAYFKVQAGLAINCDFYVEIEEYEHLSPSIDFTKFYAIGTSFTIYQSAYGSMTVHAIRDQEDIGSSYNG